MEIQEHIKYWIDSADEDLISAESNLNTKRYNWCLFIGHLVLEKALKALYVQVNNNSVPPKTHNLLKLAELSNINLSTEMSKLFAEINRFQIEARYVEYKAELYKIADEKFTVYYFEKIRESYLWLKSLIK